MLPELLGMSQNDTALGRRCWHSIHRLLSIIIMPRILKQGLLVAEGAQIIEGIARFLFPRHTLDLCVDFFFFSHIKFN